MYKNILILFTFILLSCYIYGQDWNEIYYLEGEAQYLVEEKKYDQAIDIYRRMIREVPEHSYAKYKIGLLYLETDDQKDRAIQYLEEASQNIALDFDEKSLREIRTPVDVLLYLGKAYQIANRIDEAIVVYNNFKDLIKPDNELYPLVIQRLQTCENAKAAMNHPLRVSKTNIGAPVNDDNPNFGAVVSGDGNTIIFTSYNRNYLDNYYSVKENGVWSNPKRISEKLSSKYYLRTVSLSYDGTQLYLATDDPDENDLYVCYREGKNWIEADKLDKTINGKKSNETHACVSKDGNTLYFTSDREGGLGGIDIYKSTKTAKGKWGEPQNLGSTVNTRFNEATPFLTLDDKYLFFSSEGHSSIGGFDIFYIDLESNSVAINLGYPANTPGDDLFFVPDNSLTSGYISAYDSLSIGKRDIYYISILPKINFAGNIKNASTNEEISNSTINIVVKNPGTNNIIESLSTTNGEFNFEINPGNYKIFVTNEDYDSLISDINIPEDYNESNFSYTAMLNPLAIEEEILAENTEESSEEQVTETTEEVVETNIPEDIKEESEPVIENALAEEQITEMSEPEEEIIVEEKTVKEEQVKYVPKTYTTTGTKSYSVQLMALKNPVEVDYFKNIDNVILTQYPDGFYRYTVGNTLSYQEALKLKDEIHKLGYTDAFIRINEEGKSTYTIQIMALIIPVKPDYFENLPDVVITKGADDYFRYTIGDFASYEEARNELSSIKSIGYPQAFVKKTNN